MVPNRISLESKLNGLVERLRQIDEENARLLTRFGAIQSRSTPYVLQEKPYRPPSEKRRMLESWRVDDENQVQAVIFCGILVLYYFGTITNSTLANHGEAFFCKELLPAR